MMQVKMLRNTRGSEDGFTVKHYSKDENYEVDAGLGSTFVRNGDAERTGGDEVEAAPVAEPVEAAPTIQKKNGGAAPENRMQKAPPGNKQGGAAAYEADKVYDQDGKQFVGVAGATAGAPVTLKPVSELSPDERKGLEAKGVLKAA